MKINQLKKREILLIIIFTLFLLHVYIGRGKSALSNIFPQPLVSFFIQIESRVFDHRINSRVAGHRQIKSMLEKSIQEGKYAEGSIEFARHHDSMLMNSENGKDVVILAIDEKTMEEVGQWPIRRDTYAKLMDRIFVDGGARQMVYDIVFKERSDSEPIRRLKSLRKTSSSKNRNEINKHIEFLDYDKKLEKAFFKYADKVVGGYALLQDYELAGADTSVVKLRLDDVRRLSGEVNQKSIGLLNSDVGSGGIFNYEELRLLLRYRGYFNMPQDSYDGVMRKVELLKKYRVSRVSSDRQKATSSELEIIHALSLEACKLSEEMDTLLAPGDRADLAYKIKKNDYVFLDSVLEELRSEVSDVMLRPVWLTNTQKALLKDLVSHLPLLEGNSTSFNYWLMKYVAGHFEKDHEEGFYNTLASVAGSNDGVLNKYLLRDLSEETILELKGSNDPKDLANKLELSYTNLDTNICKLWRDMIIDSVHWYLDLMHSFSSEERRKYYEYLEQNLIVDKPFILKYYKFENFKKTKGFEKVEMDGEGTSYVNYYGIKNSYLFLSLADVLNRDTFKGKLYGFSTPEMHIKDALRNKVVFLGPTATGINDWRVTPVEQQMDGVEIHTNIYDMLRKQDNVTSGGAWQIELILIILIAILVPYLLNRLGAKWGALLILGILGGYYGFCDLMFFENKTYYQFTPLAIELIVFYLYLNTRNYIIEERERKKTKAAFSNYVNASVVDKVLRDPEMLKLGGTRKEVSVLFSDVRSFTTISEGLPPEELVSLMNEYLTEMTDLVLKYDGTLDKFIGDAVMAFWGAPIDQKNHYELATLTAIDMNLKVNEMRPYFLEKYNVPIHVGIGISTGSAVVGNMGSISRFDYTMLGDTVNLGARLEGQTKNYGAELIISQTTYDYVNNWAATRFLDLIAVKGKTEPVKIYECPNRIKDCSDEYLEGLAKFNEAIEVYYMGRQFQEGIQVFEDLKKYRDGQDKACDLYIDRCKNFLENPPAEDWNGVFVATSK